MKGTDIIVPIYLDTNTLLDLLASIEDGFSVAQKVTTQSQGAESTELSGSGEFGIAAVLSLFRLDLKGAASKSKSKESAEEHQTERYHTYGSLLNKLSKPS